MNYDFSATDSGSTALMPMITPGGAGLGVVGTW